MAKDVFKKALFILLTAFMMLPGITNLQAADEIKASHVYHNHMPNFWPYYDVTQYDSTPVGGDIRYTYDGDVMLLKENPPANYTFYLPNNGGPMPHDALTSNQYYAHHAKYGAYLSWPWSVANSVNNNHPYAQLHVTMSASVINNVNSIILNNALPSYYNDPNWGSNWRNSYNNLSTPNGKRTLDMIHFTGHHTMGPLTGNEYFLKDLIYHGVTVSQDYFIGQSSYKSSKGFFPTELGFSNRLIPVLEKMGIEWSVIGNVHFSRTLKDYPYLNDPGKDMLISPPNRADLQNESNIGEWVNIHMMNEQHDTYNKFPFASTPHWVRYVDAETGEEYKVAGIPVEQASSWEEGFEGQVTANVLEPFIGTTDRKQFFVIAHDGDNNMGRAGSENTWRNAGNVTYSQHHTQGMGIDEYLQNYPIPSNDIVHVQDGSWIDTRDSASDPTWYHWHLPMGIWNTQLFAFNQVHGTDFTAQKNFDGTPAGMSVSFEYGYHYLERNFALLQAALNYAKTAEQVWLDSHPNYWQPTSARDHEITYPGNQLNPYMLSYPVKGDASNDYAGGANPAELAWYFLIASIDSGFGYYDENVDDGVKPTISFNQSLHFSKPYVESKINEDRTGPSIWWPQRYPYNPGSANNSKAEGFTKFYFDNNFAIYTYAFDVNDITDIKVKVRTHVNDRIDPLDNTCRVYDPAAKLAQGVPNITPSLVSDWTSYSMNKRNLTPDINGVDWQADGKEMMQIVPAQMIGDMYYTYLDNYRDQLLDYYIEATDSKGNVTKSVIQHVYVGTGRYKQVGDKYIEDINGDVEGIYPFMTAPKEVPPAIPSGVSAVEGNRMVELDWNDSSSADQYTIYYTSDGTTPTKSSSSIASAFSEYTHSGLTNGVTYKYKISATNEYGESGLSNEVTATPVSNETPPDTPENVSATAAEGSVSLDWSDMARATSYVIYYTSDYSTPDENSASIETNDSAYMHSGLSNGVTYNYKIQAVNAYGDSGLSAMVSATPQEAPFESNFGTDAILRLTGEEFANWDPDNSQYILSLVADNVWEKEITVASALNNTGYKFTLNGSWTVNWGGGATGTSTYLGRGGGDAKVDLNPGTYILRVTEGQTDKHEIYVEWIFNQDPELEATPSSVDLGNIGMDSQENFTINLSNAGGGTLIVNDAIESESWLDISLNGMTVNGTVNTSGLALSDYNGSIQITSNGGNVTVPVSFSVIDDTEYSISGTITESGSPVTGVTVTAGSKQATTNINGEYTISGLLNGMYNVTPSKADYTFDPASIQITVEGSDVINTNFSGTHSNVIHNWTSAYFRGTPNGWAADPMTKSTTENFIWETTITFTNGDGGGGPRFKIDRYGNWNENYPQSDEFVDPNMTYNIRFNDQTKDVTATPAVDLYSVSGTILHEGSGLDGVNVSIGGKNSLTDANGDYIISGLMSNTYTINVSKSGYTFDPSSRQVVIADTDQYGYDFTATGGSEDLTIHYSEWESASSYSVHCWDGYTGQIEMSYEGEFNGKHWWSVTISDAPSHFKFCFFNDNNNWDGGNRSYDAQGSDIYINAWDNTVYTTRP
jgi:hypothetical protein